MGLPPTVPIAKPKSNHIPELKKIIIKGHKPEELNIDHIVKLHGYDGYMMISYCEKESKTEVTAF